MQACRVFLLSPAWAGGRRGQLVLREQAAFPLALRLRSPGGAPLAEVFSFVSGLYFRGKVAYAARFAAPPAGAHGALVITPTRGLLPMGQHIDAGVLREFAGGAVELGDPRYRGPLERDLEALLRECPDAQVVLLGSVASAKYIDILVQHLGERLLFPADFVGRGDMSRGSLMLRAAESGEELAYLPVLGATLRGRRPARLEPRRWTTPGDGSLPASAPARTRAARKPTPEP